MATLALMNASCRGTVSPTDALAESSREFAEVFSFKAHLESTTESGGTVFFTEGSTAYAEDELKYASGRFARTFRNKTTETEMLFLPPDFYLRTDGKWYVRPWSQDAWSEDPPDISFDEDLLDYEKMVEKLDNVQQLSDETVDGTKYMHFSGEVPFDEMGAESGFFSDAAGVFQVDLWVDKETKLPHRMLISAGVDADVDMHTETTIDFVYNEPVIVPMPPADSRDWRNLEPPYAPCTGWDLDECLDAQTELNDIAKPTCDGPGRRICLVPMGRVDPDLVRQLVEYYQAQYGLNVTVLTPLDVPEKYVDDERRQVAANTLLSHFGMYNREAWDDPEAVLIGVTPLDVYEPERLDWDYVFSIKATFEEPVAVISSFRMRPESWGLAPDPDLTLVRVRKMLTKYIGILYYGLPENDHPGSPMFRRIYSLPALDGMTEPLVVPEAQ
jgi:predicted Zn-dependent protease